MSVSCQIVVKRGPYQGGHPQTRSRGLAAERAPHQPAGGTDVPPHRLEGPAKGTDPSKRPSTSAAPSKYGIRTGLLVAVSSARARFLYKNGKPPLYKKKVLKRRVNNFVLMGFFFNLMATLLSGTLWTTSNKTCSRRVQDVLMATLLSGTLIFHPPYFW